MQHIEPPAARPLLPDYDARMTGTGIYPPPSILLDYTYGVAAYQRWHGGQDIDQMMKDRFAEKYESIPCPPLSDLSAESDVGSEREDPHDDCEPNRQRSGKHRRSSMSDGMLRAMDDVLALSRFMKGITTEEIAAKRQRREEEEERRAQENGQEKVERWRRQTATPTFT
jgi:hypothetical protein